MNFDNEIANCCCNNNDDIMAIVNAAFSEQYRLRQMRLATNIARTTNPLRLDTNTCRYINNATASTPKNKNEYDSMTSECGWFDTEINPSIMR